MRAVCDGERVTQALASPSETIAFKVVGVSSSADAATVFGAEVDDISRRMAVDKKPTLQFVLFTSEAIGNNLLIAIDHMFADGLSLRLLSNEIRLSLQQTAGDRPLDLPTPTTSFSSWAKRLDGYHRSRRMDDEKDYWLALDRTGLESPPYDFTSATTTAGAWREYVCMLSAERTTELMLSMQRYSLHYAFVACTVHSLSRWIGTRRILLNIHLHGRNQSMFRDIDLSRTVGTFVQDIPIIFDTGNATSPTELVAIVGEQIRSVPNGGYGYSMLKSPLNPDRDSALKLETLNRLDHIIHNDDTEWQKLEIDTGVRTDDNRFDDWKRYVEKPKELAPDIADQFTYPVLAVVPLMTAGGLAVRLEYSSARFQLSTIESLAELYTESVDGFLE